MRFQTHAANKFNTDKSSLDFLVASIHMNGQIGRRRPIFLNSVTSRHFEHSSLFCSFRLSHRPRSRPQFFVGSREVDHISDPISTPVAGAMYAC